MKHFLVDIRRSHHLSCATNLSFVEWYPQSLIYDKNTRGLPWIILYFGIFDLNIPRLIRSLNTKNWALSD